MFSSQCDQPSWQEKDQFSDFTKAFIRSIYEYGDSQIRYQDIIDCIRDEFESNSRQTPHFVLQADLTDVFCEISKPLRSLIGTALNDKPSPPPSSNHQPNPKRHSLVEKIKQDADRYCTKKETMERVANIFASFSMIVPVPELSELYDVEMIFHEDLHDFPNKIAIATWLEGNTHNYFVELYYNPEEYEDIEYVPKRKPPKTLGGMILDPALTNFLGRELEEKTVTRTRDILVGYSLTESPPHSAFTLRLIPKLENLDVWEFHLTFVFSKEAIRLFYSHRRLVSVTWDNRKPVEEINWKTLELPLKDEENLIAGIGKFVSDFQESVVIELQKQFDFEAEEHSQMVQPEESDPSGDPQVEDGSLN